MMQKALKKIYKNTGSFCFHTTVIIYRKLFAVWNKNNF